MAQSKTEEQIQIQQDQLDQLSQELHDSHKEIEEMSYIASHDLQEPLRNIKTYAQLLAYRYNDDLDTKGKRYVEHIVNGVTRMQQMIDDLLEFSKGHADGKGMRNENFNNIVLDVLEMLSMTIKSNNVIIEKSGTEKLVFCDRNAIMRVVQNLVCNAIKYRSESRQPHIVIGHEGERENMEIFYVQDNGIGIAKENIPKLFNMFVRYYNEMNDTSGYGIGLTVCKKTIERHGGFIDVQSEIDRGSRFLFSIPKAKINLYD